MSSARDNVRSESDASSSSGSRGIRFDDCDNLEQLLGEMVGAASACWENLGGAGVFDCEAASRVVDAGRDRLIELGWATPIPEPAPVVIAKCPRCSEERPL